MSNPEFLPYVAIANNKDDPSNTIITRLELGFLIMFRHISNNKEIYSNFDNQISTYLSKVSGPSKDIVSQLLSRNKLMIGVQSKHNTNILGFLSMTEDNKLLLCGASISSFDIEPTTGTIGNIEELINQYYYQIIRFIIRSNKDILKNQNIHELCINFLTFLFLKVFKTPTIVDKKIDILRYVVAILYYKHFIKLDSSMAKEKAASMVSASTIAEIKSIVTDNYISKFSDIKDVIKIVVDLKIVFDTPNGLTYQMLSGLKVVSFLAVTTTLDHLIASAIAALTSVDYYKPLMINRQIQEQLEKQIIPYFNSIKYEDISNFNISSVKRDAPSGQ